MKNYIFAAISVLSATATLQAAEPTPQELVKQNNEKATPIVRTLQGLMNWQNSKLPRNPEFISSNVTELVKLVKLPSGANIITEAGAYALAARVYANPLNLRLHDLAKKNYSEAIRLAAAPAEKAGYSFDYADYMLRAAMEGDPAQWEKVKLEAYSLPELSPAAKLNLLARGVPGLSLEKDGWELVKDLPDLQGQYYTSLLQSIRSAGYSNYNKKANPFDYSTSEEHKLEVADKALACEPALQRGKRFFAECKIEALTRLEHYSECEKFLYSLVASDNQRERADYSAMLGDFYVGRAKRYYSEPESSILAKASAAYAVAIAHSPSNMGLVRKQIDTLIQMKNYQDAISSVDYYVSLCRDKVADRVANRYYGDIYYMMGDYARACEYYDKFDDTDKAHQRRYAEALYAVGRYDDAIAHIKRSYDYGSHREANKYFIRKIEEKKAAIEAR